jgi:hypothetical protein
VVLTKLVKPRSPSRRRTSNAASATCSQPTPGSGSRSLDLVGVATPRVDLERAELREPDEARHVVDLHVIDERAVFFAQLDRADRLRRTGKDLLLEEARFVAAVGTTHERERTISELRQHPVGDDREVCDELSLRDALLGIEHLVEVRQLEVER